MKARLHTSQFSLARNEVFTLESARGHVLRCLEGALWLTTVDLPGDHILQTGDCFTIAGRAQIVIEALEPARVTLVAPAKPWLAASRNGQACTGPLSFGIQMFPADAVQASTRIIRRMAYEIAPYNPLPLRTQARPVFCPAHLHNRSRRRPGPAADDTARLS